MQTSLATPYVFAALIVILGANAGLTETLGAHPFWSIRVAWVGVPLGLIAALSAKRLGLGWRHRVLAFLVCAAAAYVIAATGKDRFASSFAEDAFAGRMWYFGWIAACGFGTALIAAIFSPTRKRTAD